MIQCGSSSSFFFLGWVTSSLFVWLVWLMAGLFREKSIVGWLLVCSERKSAVG
jgi:hypothetical protein